MNHLGQFGAPSGERVRSRGLFIESLLLAAVAILVLNLHPFGSVHLRRHFSQDLVYAWFGRAHWLYPRPPSPASPGSLKRPRAVVMLVDEPALALRAARWPVPLTFHAQILAEVAVLRPRAVMLDFLLIDRAPPQDVCEFLMIADTLREARIPLYLAVTGSDDLAQLDAPNCSDDAGRRLQAASVLTPVSVRREVDEADFVSRFYPFEQVRAGQATGTGLISAAVRMYCDTTAQRESCATSLARRYARDAGFELAWSPRGDPFNERWSQTPCTSSDSPLRAIFTGTMLPQEAGCAPIASLFASALLSPEQDPRLDNEQLSSLVNGSIVMIGGDFRASGDLISTPMHTLLPGVYYHAVALENLLMFDGRPKVREEFRRFRLAVFGYDLLVLWALSVIFLCYRRMSGVSRHEAGPWAPSTSARVWFANLIARTPVALSVSFFVIASLLLATYPLLQLAVIVAAVPAMAAIEIRVTARWELKQRLRVIALYLLALGVSLCVIAAAVWFGYRWLSLPPGDWIGYLSFSTVGFYVAHSAIVDLARHIGSIRSSQNSIGGVA